MRTINKRLQNEDLKVFYAFDESSPKGFPTKESFVLTSVYDPKTHNVGFSFKMPGDEFIPKIGKAIAYRNLKNKPHLTKEIGEDEPVYPLLSDYVLYAHLNKRKISKQIMYRIGLVYLLQKEMNDERSY